MRLGRQAERWRSKIISLACCSASSLRRHSLSPLVSCRVRSKVRSPLDLRHRLRDVWLEEQVLSLMSVASELKFLSSFSDFSPWPAAGNIRSSAPLKAPRRSPRDRAKCSSRWSLWWLPTRISCTWFERALTWRWSHRRFSSCSSAATRKSCRRMECLKQETRESRSWSTKLANSPALTDVASIE